MTKQSFVKGAVILTLAALSVKLVGAFFRIVLAMVIKDEGIGLFQMAYPVYSALLAVSTAGIPIAISKLVAENLACGNYRGAFRVFNAARVILAVSGLVISLLMFFGAHTFITLFRLDPRAYLVLVSISPAIFFVTIMSAYRGFFQGQQQMLPTAISQIVEQLGKVAAALILIMFLKPKGLAYQAAGASFGAAAGAFLGIVVLLFFWWGQRSAFLANVKQQKKDDYQRITETIGRIFALAVPITLGSLVLPLMNIVDLSLVPQRLYAAGFNESRATALYGQLTGMASPLVHIPTIITVSLAVTLVPAISEALALRRKRVLQERAYLAVRVTLLLGIPCSLGLYLLAEPISVMLFNNQEAGSVLAVMALAVVFLTLYQTTAGILQGLGRTMDPVIALFWGAAAKTIFTWFLTSLPTLHIRGAALASVIGFGIAAILNMQRMQNMTEMSLRPAETIVKPVVAAVVMGIGVVAAYHYILPALAVVGARAANAAAVVAAVTSGAMIYFLALLLLGAIKREDLLLLPIAGPFFARLAERFYLIRG